MSTCITARLRQSYLHSMLGRSVTFHEITSSSGAVSLALSSHCNTIQSGLSDKFGLSLQNISTVVSAFVVAFISQWKLTLITATIIPATVLVIGITSAFDSKYERCPQCDQSQSCHPCRRDTQFDQNSSYAPSHGQTSTEIQNILGSCGESRTKTSTNSWNPNSDLHVYDICSLCTRILVWYPPVCKR